ncbi:hypothetical protein SSX86_013812 [Deinandra increscens subsp. villosa]|uniref:Uncharacterized protein n=1 Tax=Deinandra increscens subsp. villosa TaxID=3103831 RepID=A0AAP0D882_9ASTR
MTDQQRSAFRFRVPRLRPSVPPPRTTAATRALARKPPVQPQPQPSTPSPIPPQQPPAPPLEPLASPLQKPPLSPPTPPQEPPALPQKPPPSPPTPPQEPPAIPQVRYLGPIPVPPPEPPVQPSPAQQEALVQPSPPRQDEPASMANEPIQATPPSSPSQSHVSAKPASPSTGFQPIPQSSSPQHVHPSQQAEAKTSTEIDSSDYSNSESDIEENQHEIGTTNNIPNTPQTKSMISHPDDKIPVPESPGKCQPNGPQHSMSEETTGKKPPNQKVNENPVIVTLAGDNRGTSMHIGSGATKREKSIHIHRRYKVNPYESSDTMTDEEEKEKDSKANENEENFSYINCNIQGINNSMVFNCSITEKSPGVHLGSCDKENVNKPKKKYIMSKVKVNSTPSQKHTVRRRCLRGLFMESSDSDPNDPQRPRRHGCRYMSEDKSNKDDKTDAV